MADLLGFRGSEPTRTRGLCSRPAFSSSPAATNFLTWSAEYPESFAASASVTTLLRSRSMPARIHVAAVRHANAAPAL